MTKLALCMLVFVVGCGAVGSDQWDTAAQWCQPHGGIAFVDATLSSHVFVTCKDNTSIAGHIKDKP